MNKILTSRQAIDICTSLRDKGKRIVLAGGCFDILHVGHIAYLTGAKKEGDVLFVMLESDQAINNSKGPNRPINNQADRAKVLGSLEMVDYIILLPDFKNDKDYDDLVSSVKPDIIAITKGDKTKLHKDRQARLINAEVVETAQYVSNQSTTRLIKILKEI